MAYFHVGGGALFVGTDEGIGGLSELSGRIESGALNRTAADDRELASDLVERAGADRREAKLHIEVGRQPAIVLPFEGAEVAEDDMGLALAALDHHAIDDIRELVPSTSIVQFGHDLAGSGDWSISARARRAAAAPSSGLWPGRGASWSSGNPAAAWRMHQRLAHRD